MRIAVIGGGVIGLIYAAGLTRAGHDVVVRARGARARLLADKGVPMAEPGADPTLFRPTMTDVLPADLDLALVAVRARQLDAAVMPLLGADSEAPILTLSNAPSGHGGLRTLNPARIVGGFPGVGGHFDDEGVLRYVRIPDQPTTVESKGKSFNAWLVRALEGAGFPVAVESRMDNWLRTHAVFICGLGGAVVQAGSCTTLASDHRGVADMILSVREGFQALSTLQIDARPFKLPAIFCWTPRFISVPFWARKLTTPSFTVGLAPHVLDAVTEMAEMARDVRAVLAPANRPMPHLERMLTLLEDRLD